MWHNVGLTLLVFVATLLIVLLLMVCGEWGVGGNAGGGRESSRGQVSTVVTSVVSVTTRLSRPSSEESCQLLGQVAPASRTFRLSEPSGLAS